MHHLIQILQLLYMQTSVTRWLNYYFTDLAIDNNKNLPNSIKMCQSRFRTLPHTKLVVKKWPKGAEKFPKEAKISPNPVTLIEPKNTDLNQRGDGDRDRGGDKMTPPTRTNKREYFSEIIFWMLSMSIRCSYLNGLGDPGLFFVYLRSCQTNNIILLINVKKCPSSIGWCNSNSRPLEHESSPITNRPGLLPIRSNCLYHHFMVSEICSQPIRSVVNLHPWS